MSAAAAESLAVSAKQLPPLGHLFLPGHSLEVTLTFSQVALLGSKESSDRSPVTVSFAHSIIEFMCSSFTPILGSSKDCC